MGIKTQVASQIEHVMRLRFDVLTPESWQSVCAALVAASVLLRAAEEREIQSFGAPYEVRPLPHETPR
jgi:hypothetical protein